MNRNRWLPVLAAVALLVSLVIAGCSDNNTTRISDLLANPHRYYNRDVRVAGEVTQVYELPLGITNTAAYRVNDNTGQIWVISHAGAPVRGDRIRVTGRLEPIAQMHMPVIGDILGDVLEETQRRARY